MWIIENFLPIFVKILKYASNERGEKPIISTNLIRQILMRVKPMLGSQKNKLVVISYVVLRESLVLLANSPMEREEAGVFSPEDPDNVTISNSLPAIIYEFWPSILYQFNCSNNLPIMNECLKICTRISQYNVEFFKTSNRFSADLWPKIKPILSKHVNNQLFLIKTQLSVLEFLKEMLAVEPSLVPDIVKSVVLLFELKEENKEITLQAFSQRLIELRDSGIKIIQEVKKSNPKILEEIKNIYSFKGRQIVTLWDLCASFFSNVSNSQQ